MSLKINLIQNLRIIFVLILFIPLLHKLNHDLNIPPVVISKQDSAINVSNNLLLFLNLGNKRFLSSLFWIKTLLDSDLDHYSKDDLNSWLYLRFKTIVTLDPNFKEAYQFGSLYLAIIKDDIQGAREMFELGLKKFPDDYMLNFNAGYHYYFEMGDQEKAVECFERLLNRPTTPSYLPSLIGRIKAETGDLETAYTLLISAYERAKDERVKERYDRAIYALKAEIDLNCLNQRKGPCVQRTDFHGKAYIQDENGVFTAQEPWKPFRPSSKTKKGAK